MIDYEPYFINPLPIVTEDGVLKVLPAFTDYSWILGTNDPVYQALAAEFLLFMAGVFGQGVDSRNSPFYAYATFNSWGLHGIPTRLNGFTHSEGVLGRHFRRIYLPQDASWRYDEARAFETMDELIIHFGNMEMRRHNVHPRSLRAIIIEELTDFQEGVLTARETAQRLQGRMELAIRG